MELSFNPLWDERGQLRRGCTIHSALSWLTTYGNYSMGDSVNINGELYTVGNLLYQERYSKIAEMQISNVRDGYSRHLGFIT